MLPRTMFLPLFALLFAAPALAGEPYLVKDINPTFANGGSRPEGFSSLGDAAVFSARTAETGRELWGSDGTAGGTFLLHESCAGNCSGSPRAFLTPTPLGHFFLGRGGLWVTRGTSVSTFRLTGGVSFPLNTPESARQKVWSDVQGLLYFTAGDRDHGMELWRSDGTAAGTFRVADVRPGPEGSNPKELTVFNGRVFFSADDGASGPALWQSDGTPAGTRLVKDTWGPHPPNSQGPALLQAVGRTLFFTAPSPGSGVELWKSDGTTRGTSQVADLSPRNASTSFRDAVLFGDRLLFVAVVGNQGQELWITDGTQKGTRKLTAFSSPRPLVDGRLRPRVPLGNRFVFEADEGRYGNELWVTDGTPDGTRLLRDSCPGSCPGLLANYWVSPLVHQGRIFFSRTDGQRGFEPWVTDGTAAGTRLLRDIYPGKCDSSPLLATPLGNRVLFFALTGEEGRDGQEIWRTDGTTAGTVRVSDFATSHPLEDGSSAAVVSGAVLFSGVDGAHGAELWRTDGTRQGTFLVADIERGNNAGSFPRQFMRVGRTLYFFAFEGTAGLNLWKSDGTEAGTSRVSDDIPPLSAVSNAAAPAGTGGPFLFLADLAGEFQTFLYRSDGTEAGTFPIELDEGVHPWLPKGVQAAGGKVFFVASDEAHGSELWVSDGTRAGTRLVEDLVPGKASSFPQDLTAFGGRVFFSTTYDGIEGSLWVSNGTPAGTFRLRQFSYEAPRNFVVHGGFLYFLGDEDGYGTALWRTDGTKAGTVRLVDFSPDGGFSFGYNLLSIGTRLLLWDISPEGYGQSGLWVSDGTQAGTRKISPVLPSDLSSDAKPVVLDGVVYFGGWERDRDALWRSDGTEAGTYPVRTPGGGFAPPPWSLAAAGNRLYFTSGALGIPLWQSDGTPEGTVRIRELVPGGEGSPELAVAGSRVFFSARDPIAGHELWAIAPE
jgi:trimeric autotransporter adhesin